MEEQFESILNPTKCAEEAMDVDLADKLENYLQMYVKGSTDETNFNSAAMLIQGSSNLYSKKVEYLYNLASNLHDTLTKHNQKDDNKIKDPKEKGKRESKTEDPFCSTEIKVGKNLSCLRKRNGTIKKFSMKTWEREHPFVPVDLLPLEGEEKGDPFYNTRGELIGNRNDYTLNKCNITTSGWLLMPTVSPDNITESLSIEGSPADEGYPGSSGCPSAPSSRAVSLSLPGSSQQTDEGIGLMSSTSSDGALSQPSEGWPSQPGGSSQKTPMEYEAVHVVKMENFPLDDFPTDKLAAGSKPQRKALQQVGLQPGEQQESDDEGPDDLISVIRPIEKNNCYLRCKKAEPTKIFPASVYSGRTLFSVDPKLKKKDWFSLENKALANNTKFQNKIKSFMAAIKDAKAKRKAATVDVATDDEVETEDDEEREAISEDENSFAANPGLTDDDFEEDPVVGGENPMAKENPDGKVSKEDNMNAGASNQHDGNRSEHVTEEDMTLFRDDLLTMDQTVEMNKRVRNWQKIMNPFLEDIKQREKFDINHYGSQILNAFDGSNRRQTIFFRNFCRGMDKYQIHRYFLSLLPLANVGNVSIANEESDDGQGEDIAITLLSRRMHHMELEEFGHNEGEHN